MRSSRNFRIEPRTNKMIQMGVQVYIYIYLYDYIFVCVYVFSIGKNTNSHPAKDGSSASFRRCAWRRSPRRTTSVPVARPEESGGHGGSSPWLKQRNLLNWSMVFADFPGINHLGSLQGICVFDCFPCCGWSLIKSKYWWRSSWKSPPVSSMLFPAKKILHVVQVVFLPTTFGYQRLIAL